MPSCPRSLRHKRKSALGGGRKEMLDPPNHVFPPRMLSPIPKGHMVRHGGSVTFQDDSGETIKCRRCQCEYCNPKRFDSHQRREPVWCEEPQQQQQQQQQPPPPPPPRRQDSQVRFDQRHQNGLDSQTICYEEPFLFRRLESLIRKNQEGIVIKQNEDGFLIKKAEQDHPPEQKKRVKSKKSPEPQETDSDSSAAPSTEQPEEPPAEAPPPAAAPPPEEKKSKKEKKKKKKKDKDKGDG